MDTPRTLHPHLELGDICRISRDILYQGEHPEDFGLVVGGVEGQVVDLLVGNRRFKLNRRWLEPLAREVLNEAR